MVYWTGQEDGFWDGTVILYAVVEDECKQSRDGMYDFFKLRPLATIVGEFDPASCSSLEVKALFSTANTGDLHLPERQSRILIVIKKLPDGYWLHHAKLLFMPEDMAISKISGDPTPAIEKVLKAVKLVRAKKS